MRKIVTVRNVKIGEGIPKICVPIVGTTKEEIVAQAKALKGVNADLVEWRVDWFEGVFDLGAVKEAAKALREVVKEMPILFTFRTSKEGGERAIKTEAYVTLNKEMAASRLIDLVDVQLFTGDVQVQEIIEVAHKNGVCVIASNHDFEKTPPKEEIIARLLKMQQLGADILKIAVMPTSKRDVLELLLATNEMYENYAKQPIITMSMAGMGVISRLAGEVFGSALTFGAVKKASAPGQIAVKELGEVLEVLHRSI